MMPKTISRGKGNLIILSGPSGAGKTTLRKALQRRIPDLQFSVSWTTRPPRKGEIDGRDYRFVTSRRFEAQIRKNGFLEWARVHGAWYGTPRVPVNRWLDRGQDVLLDIDTQGARQVKESFPESIGVFILPPSLKELMNRLKKRRSESAA